ncbi:MAG: TonB-dependent receptor [Deltaproteobacteria bacterium]|nr:TonB-dependent receptor [Deltaproteobacteria bacterium]
MRRLIDLIFIAEIWMLTSTILVVPRASSAHDVGPALAGQVVDDDSGEPIPGVVVSIQSADGTQLRATTDSMGRFLFLDTPAGDLDVFVTGEPLQAPLQKRLSEEDRAGWLNLRARRQRTRAPAETLTSTETLTIVAPRSVVPVTASTTLITARDMAAVPRRTAEDALRLVPGLTLVQHGSEGKGHQFFLRGFDAIHGADIEITLEGLPINEWSNVHAQGYIDLGFIIPETIASVEVTKGPFTLSEGAFAMAGSATYRLGLSPDDLGVRVAYTAGSTNRHRVLLTYTPSDGDGHDFIACESTHDDGFGQNRSIDRASLLGRVRIFDDLDYGTLSLLGAAYFAAFELPGTVRDEDVRAGTIDFFDTYDRGQHGRSVRGLLAASYEWRRGDHQVLARVFGGRRQLDLLENYTGFLVDAIHGDRHKQTDATFAFGADFTYGFDATKALHLDLSLGTRGNDLEQAQQHVDSAETVLDTTRNLAGLETLSHAGLGLTWYPAAAWRLDAGVRIDAAYVSVRSVDDDLDRPHAGEGARLLLSPRTTLKWQAHPTLQFFFAYGRGFRPPEARAFLESQTGPTGYSEERLRGQRPEMTSSDAFEVGMRWNPSASFSTALSGFATFIARESIFDHVSGTSLELNSTRRVGAEVEFHTHFTDWVAVDADATYVDARFVGSGRPIPLAPTLSGRIRITIAHEDGFRAGLQLVGIAPRPLPHGAWGAPLTRLDGTAGYSWGWLRCELELENIVNQSIREGEYHYASHWTPEEHPSAIPVLHEVAGPPFNARLTLTVIL